MHACLSPPHWSAFKVLWRHVNWFLKVCLWSSCHLRGFPYVSVVRILLSFQCCAMCVSVCVTHTHVCLWGMSVWVNVCRFVPCVWKGEQLIVFQELEKAKTQEQTVMLFYTTNKVTTNTTKTLQPSPPYNTVIHEYIIRNRLSWEKNPPVYYYYYDIMTLLYVILLHLPGK